MQKTGKRSDLEIFKNLYGITVLFLNKISKFWYNNHDNSRD